MCGRFALATEKHILEMLFEFELRAGLAPRFNIAPSEEILALRRGVDGKREAALLKWGLTAYRAKQSRGGKPLINARAETADQKPTFRDAFRRRRVLIPASGFYEWKSTGSGKQPFLIRMENKQPFALGGLWESRLKTMPMEECCVILTVSANEKVAPIHDRMPLIIDPQAYQLWLDSEAGLEEIKKLAAPYPAEKMELVLLPAGIFKTGRFPDYI
jgi:putative SOS response-associated peptidase YedK